VTTVATGTERAPALLGQTVVVIGGSAGIGRETARQARAEGAEVIVTGRNPERLERAGHELGALRTAAFDATDPDSLERFFDGLPEPIDHVMLSGSGPYCAPLAEADFEEVRRDVGRHLLLPAQIALLAVGRRPAARPVSRLANRPQPNSPEVTHDAS
jgi:NAD(P)-dependent dehydrogenase (short-subunit alcohol dehydrogenase family)